MKKILPPLLVALGLAALGLIVWFVGPLVAVADWRPLEAPLVRGLLIAALVAGYGAIKLWALIKARRTNSELTAGLVQAAKETAPSASAEEIAALTKRFEEAVGILKNVRVAAAGKKPRWTDLLALSGKQYLYQLPWYIFIGAPGSGKTTALINSGLQFPLAEKFGTNAIRGVGGTRNCDWWFTDEAVLLDTAGRYTTQESDRQADEAAWKGFLRLLKKFRPRRPINGVILTISIGDLLQQSAAEQESHVAALRARLQELHAELDIAFPIYVMVTKCDLLAGFMEFFGDLGKDERAQVWGMTFPYRDAAGDPLPAFAGEFAALERRLFDRWLDRLQREPDAERRARIHAFPPQFASLGPLLGGFLERVFASSRFGPAPMLRGVYFTSGTQEGSPIDRLMGSLARACGLAHKMLPPHAGSGRSYFLTALLRRVVFQEQGLAGTNLKWEQRRTLSQWAAYAACIAVALAAATAWMVSYGNNRAYVAGVERRLEVVRQQLDALPATPSGDVLQLLPTLQAVRRLADNGDETAPSAAMGYGLYQGAKLAAAADSAYRRLLREAFLPRLALRVEEQLRTAASDNLEFAYEALKTYLMLHDAGHADADALKAWVSLDWDLTFAQRQVTPEQRQALDRHLAALLELGAVTSPVPPDRELIQRARSLVAAQSLPQRVYSRLRRQGVGKDFPSFTVAAAGGPAAPLVFARASGKPLTEGVPGLYSFDGYHKAFTQAAARVTQQLAEEEGWVLGSQGSAGRLTEPGVVAQLTEEVRRLYLNDYVRVWEAFIDDIRLKRPLSLVDSIQTARVLSAGDSPLPLLLRAISRETTLATKAAADPSIADKAAAKVASAKEELIKMLGGGAARPVGGAAAVPESLVDERFAGLRRLVTPAAPGQPAPIDQATALVNELYTLLNATDTAVKGGNAPPPSDVPNKVKADAARMPEPLRSMLQTLSGASESQTLGATRKNISSSLSSSIGEFCQQAIAGRYPFVRSSQRDVTQDDFGRLFAPGGLFDEFFQKNLAPYVDVTARPWGFRRVNDQTMGNSASLVQFQRAAAIRDTFFRGGNRVAELRLEFRPLEMDPAISQFTLDVDGQVVRYSHGPLVPQTIQWPGRGSGQVRVQIQPPAANGTAAVVTDGPWALFRLFDKMSIEPSAQPERFRVTFNIEGRRAVFEVLASSVHNPFRLRDLSQFECPSGL